MESISQVTINFAVFDWEQLNLWMSKAGIGLLVSFVLVVSDTSLADRFGYCLTIVT